MVCGSGPAARLASALAGGTGTRSRPGPVLGSVSRLGPFRLRARPRPGLGPLDGLLPRVRSGPINGLLARVRARAAAFLRARSALGLALRPRAAALGPTPASGPAPGPTPAAVRRRATVPTALVLDQADPAAVNLGIVEFLQGVFHVRIGREFNDSLIAVMLMSVGVRDLAGLAHVIFQVLPANAGGKVLNGQTVFGACGRAVALVGAVIIATGPLVPASGGPTRLLHSHAFP